MTPFAGPLLSEQMPHLDGDDNFDPEFDDAPAPPSWVFDAAAERDRAELVRAAGEAPDVGTAAALMSADPATLDADGLLDAVAASQRLVNYAQAMQQRCLAAFARPGVATSLENSVEAALHPEGKGDQPFRPLADTIPDDLPVDDDGEVDFTPLLELSDWRQALEAQAAKDASAEVGCALNLAPVTARTRTEKALAMVDGLPATLAAWQRGDLDGYRAGIIADRTAVLSRQQCRDVEQRLVPVAQERTGAALRRLADREVIAADPESAERRARAATQRRGVTLSPDEDGLAGVHLTASAPDAALVHGVLDSVATSIRAAGGADGRGASQLRADVMVDVFRSLNDTGHVHLGKPGGTAPDAATGAGAKTRVPSATGAEPCPCDAGAAAPRPCDAGSAGAAADTTHTDATAHSNAGNSSNSSTARHHVTLNVYLDAATLAGFDNNPADLAGHGALTADTARALAKSADRVRAIITRPPGPDRTRGTILDAGRTVYRPPVATADYVTARDRVCQFPGCRASAARCDLDHRQPFEKGGETNPDNLMLLCRAHHRLKTFGGWRAEPIRTDPIRTGRGHTDRSGHTDHDDHTGHGHGDTGTNLTWTSPLGRRYPSEPGHVLTDGPSVDTHSSRSPVGTPSSRMPVQSHPADPPPF